MTGCGCLLLIAALVGLIAFVIFGSTDPGEPVESAVVLMIALLLAKLVRRRGRDAGIPASRTT